MQTPNIISEPTKFWTISSLLEPAKNSLEACGFEDARLNVELLLAHVLGVQRTQLYANYDRQIESNELADFNALLERRLAHEPLQYILGETEFMGLPLYVNSSVLVPRPETELLVEKTLETIKAKGNERVEILEVGTGSGNIPIALAHFAENAVITSIEVSAPALEIAARNIQPHGFTRISLHQEDVFSDFLPGKTFDIIVSNPPYVSKEDFERLEPEIKDYEPRVATTDGGDGYAVIKRVIEVAAGKLKPNGSLLLEIAYNQSGETERIARSCGFSDVEFFNDFSGIPRIVRACR
jgi:release factor glutamine methyltransferase